MVPAACALAGGCLNDARWDPDWVAYRDGAESDGGTTGGTDEPWIAFYGTGMVPYPAMYFVRADGTGLTEFCGETQGAADPDRALDGRRLAYVGVESSPLSYELRVRDFDAGTDVAVPV